MFSPDIISLFNADVDSPLLIITVGNTLHRDDGVGPSIAFRCEQAASGITVYNAGERPENIPAKVEMLSPRKTVIIDAAHFGGVPGEVRIIPEESIPQSSLSTHMFPLAVVSKIIREDSGAEVVFLGIQVKDVGMGEGLSKELEESACKIAELISKGGSYA